MWRGIWKVRSRTVSEEIIQEVLPSVLVARLGQVVLREEIVIGMILLPFLLLPLLRDSGFLLLLQGVVVSTSLSRTEEKRC